MGRVSFITTRDGCFVSFGTCICCGWDGEIGFVGAVRLGTGNYVFRKLRFRGHARFHNVECTGTGH